MNYFMTKKTVCSVIVNLNDTNAVLRWYGVEPQIKIDFTQYFYLCE